MTSRLSPSKGVMVITLMAAISSAAVAQKQPEKIIGMYVHESWTYNRPYAARIWTVEDWRGYADGLKKLGYNSMLIWPLAETMPDPLLPSDRASLTRLQRVVDILHNEYQMRVYIVLCPNLGPINEVARRAPFETRRFFYADQRINPADRAAMAKMMRQRERIFKYMAKADGVAIIDSDPGGYPGSTNREFVDLLLEHRKMFDRVRPGIELIYWMHVGWAAYSRWYATGKFKFGSDEEFVETLQMLKEANPEPWGVAGGVRHPYVKAGLTDRMIGFNYGRIEGEPSFPTTNFGGNAAYEGGRDMLGRGVMGNAQTHCVQLPNTFAFAQGAVGGTLRDDDYVAFADRLIRGQGKTILEGWKTLVGDNSAAMRATAARFEKLAAKPLQTGDLQGMLFGSPRRFLTDLVMMLRMKAAYRDFAQAVARNDGVTPALTNFLRATELWQGTHGYENLWWTPELNETLRKLNSVPVNRVLDYNDVGGVWFNRNPGATPFQRIKTGYRNVETYTPQLLAALRQTLAARQKQ